MFSVHRRFVVPLCVLSGALWSGFALAATQSFQAPLVGTQQVPAVETSGVGMADLTHDPATRVVTWTITYGGSSGPVTMGALPWARRQGRERCAADLAHEEKPGRKSHQGTGDAHT
jgi:hypothetical protein